ncbi:MAG TPA: endonuclease domain-containing protein [Verrucomicrobiae bacterium]|nr:endonuclease domain-containing protein [Verrucomicrobiae bacterium]
MTPKYHQFIFEDYSFDADAGSLQLHYSFDSTVKFTEKYQFDFDFIAYDATILDRAIQNLFFIAGVSYYKTFLAPEIVIKSGQLDEQSAAFFSKTYQRGLGEFFFVNKLDPHTPITFPANTDQLVAPQSAEKNEGLLIGIGGGKDSLVSVELLRSKADNLATWSMDHQSQLKPLIDRIGLPHFWVSREWDRSLLEHNKTGAYNGHVPISAIIGCVGAVVAILSGRQDIVVSNEQSANEPTLHYQGVDINHQYSKSQEFERDYQDLLAHTLGDHVRYYSLLRPLTEVRIADIFAHVGFEKYHDVFSSCNRAFTHDSDHMFWDGSCPKCAFVFLALTPFIAPEELEALFSGKNLLKDPSLQTTYRQLLGIEGDKPLECVGEVKESRAAMRIASSIHPELADIYHYELPEGYDYKALGSHEMPSEVYDLVAQAFRA